MNRREFLKSCFGATMAATFFDSSAGAGGLLFSNKTTTLRLGRKRFNVLFVLVDQWRFCAMSHGAHHDRLVWTPNLDKLAKQGVHWSRCYATHPVCTPNRSTIITGRWPWQTGMNANNLMLPPSERCIAHEFTDAGYNCHYIGKWHMDGEGKFNGAGYVPPGWRRRGFTKFEGFNRGHNYWYSNSFMMTDDGRQMKYLGYYPPDTYEPTFQTDIAIDFMRQNTNNPFFCFVSWGPPHTPYGEHPDTYTYNAADVVVRPNVPAGSVSNARSSLKDYFSHCTAMDHDFGRLMKTLDEEGLADNTLVVFTADHGDMHRSHGLTYKGKPEEESWHIPLIMRLPGEIKPGQVVGNLISSADLMPTILSICGLNVPATCTGKDKSAAMGAQGLADESIYGGTQANWRGVVKGDYKLVMEVADGSEVPSKMYNLADDPYELTNLVNKPEHAATQVDLTAEITMWKTRTSDSFPQKPWNAEKWYEG